MPFLESLASHTAPICFGVSGRGDSKIEVCPGSWPPRFSDPDPHTGFDSVDDIPSLSECLVVDVVTLLNAAAFEVGVSIQCNWSD